MTRFFSGFVVLAAVLTAAPLRAAPPGGFEGIPFGETRANVRAAVIAKLKIQPFQAFDAVELRGEGDLRLVDQADAIALERYKFNGRPVDALLIFNANGRFFRVEYDAQPRPVAYFRTATRDDALFFSKAFRKIYGAPTFEMNPKPVEMRPGSVAYFWRWTKGHDTVYTAIAAGDEDFGAIAVVSDDALMREPAALHAPDADVSESTETMTVSDTGASPAASADNAAPAASPAP